MVAVSSALSCWLLRLHDVYFRYNTFGPWLNNITTQHIQFIIVQFFFSFKELYQTNNDIICTELNVFEHFKPHSNRVPTQLYHVFCSVIHEINQYMDMHFYIHTPIYMSTCRVYQYTNMNTLFDCAKLMHCVGAFIQTQLRLTFFFFLRQNSDVFTRFIHLHV